MKELFPGYYQPTESEFNKLWESCIFTFDANVLLNFYRYSQTARDELFDILASLSDRIWISHQTALEYQRNRLTVINQQYDIYYQLTAIIDGTKKQIKEKLENLRYHPSIDETQVMQSFEKSITSFKTDISAFKQAHPDYRSEDKIRNQIATIFKNKIGRQFTQIELDELYLKGSERYLNNIPPGYKDNNKTGLNKYGDLILWFQIIDKASEVQNPFILVTDEKKEDWWLKTKEGIISPLPELINEFFTLTGQKFYLYSIDSFIKHASKLLKIAASKEVIKELEDIRILDENYAKKMGEINDYLTHQLALINQQFTIPDSMKNILGSVNFNEIGEIHYLNMYNQLVQKLSENTELLSALNRLKEFQGNLEIQSIFKNISKYYYAPLANSHRDENTSNNSKKDDEESDDSSLVPVK